MTIRRGLMSVMSLVLAAGWLTAQAEGPDGSMADERLPSNVTIQGTTLGPVYADARGRTMYILERDRLAPGKSTCTTVKSTHTRNGENGPFPIPDLETRKNCEQKFPPVGASAGFEPFGLWSSIEREPGINQLTRAGLPLYTSIKDRAPGEVNAAGGVGFDFARSTRPAIVPLDAPPGVERRDARTGLLLRVDEGFLFTHHKEGLIRTSGGSGSEPDSCTGACLRTWRPFTTTLGIPRGEWSTVMRSDGMRQWTYRDEPVYIGPASVDEAVRAAPSFAGAWRPIVEQPAAALPADIGVKRLLPGIVYVTRTGMTLYAWRCQEFEATDQLPCDDPGDTQVYFRAVCGQPEICAENWRPYYASADAQPSGDWSLMKANDPRVWVTPPGSEDTRSVWAYRGRAVFTHAADREPGDFNGNGANLWVLAEFGMIHAVRPYK